MARTTLEILKRGFFRLRRQHCDRLAIFMFHGVIRSPLKVYYSCFVNDSLFRNQLEYIERHFEVLPLSVAVERLKGGRINRPTATITFDDGFQNIYDFAFPILQKRGIPAAIFPITGFVNSNDSPWFCRFNHALGETSKLLLDWNGCTYDISNQKSKVQASIEIKSNLKKFPQPQLLDELNRIILNLGQDPDGLMEADSPFRMLSEEAIKRMAASGLIEVGAHSHSHAILSLLSEAERHEEIDRSIAAVREWTGRPCELFAYPNGFAEDYDQGVIKILESGGIRIALTAIGGPNDKDTSFMELKRYVIDDRSMVNLKRKVRRIIEQDLVNRPS